MEISNYIKLTFKLDTDGTGELTANFNSNGFSGTGSAWFDQMSLIEFSKKIMAYPLPTDEPLEIEGGFWSSEKQNTLEQTHLFLKVYPVNQKGDLGVRVEVATPRWETDRPESIFSAKGEIKTNYNALERFAKQLKKLAENEIEEAVLKEQA
jgi:hypothetical protein